MFKNEIKHYFLFFRTNSLCSVVCLVIHPYWDSPWFRKTCIHYRNEDNERCHKDYFLSSVSLPEYSLLNFTVYVHILFLCGVCPSFHITVDVINCYYKCLHHILWCFDWFLDWVDTVWDLEFTERKLLDNTIEEELAISGEKAFLTLYKCVLAHSADQQQPPNRDGASLVNICPHAIVHNFKQQHWIQTAFLC